MAPPAFGKFEGKSVRVQTLHRTLESTVAGRNLNSDAFCTEPLVELVDVVSVPRRTHLLSQRRLYQTLTVQGDLADAPMCIRIERI